MRKDTMLLNLMVVFVFLVEQVCWAGSNTVVPDIQNEQELSTDMRATTTIEAAEDTKNCQQEFVKRMNASLLPQDEAVTYRYEIDGSLVVTDNETGKVTESNPNKGYDPNDIPTVSKSMDVINGREFTIRLEMDPCMGFEWRLATPLDEPVDENGNIRFKLKEQKYIPAEKVAVWVFEADYQGPYLCFYPPNTLICLGEGRINFEYVSPGKKETVKKQEEYTITIWEKTPPIELEVALPPPTILPDYNNPPDIPITLPEYKRLKIGEKFELELACKEGYTWELAEAIDENILKLTDKKTNGKGAMKLVFEATGEGVIDLELICINQDKTEESDSVRFIVDVGEGIKEEGNLYFINPIDDKTVAAEEEVYFGIRYGLNWEAWRVYYDRGSIYNQGYRGGGLFVEGLPEGAQIALCGLQTSDGSTRLMFRWTPDNNQKGEYEITFGVYCPDGSFVFESTTITVTSKPKVSHADKEVPHLPNPPASIGGGADFQIWPPEPTVVIEEKPKKDENPYTEAKVPMGFNDEQFMGVKAVSPWVGNTLERSHQTSAGVSDRTFMHSIFDDFGGANQSLELSSLNDLLYCHWRKDLLYK